MADYDDFVRFYFRRADGNLIQFRATIGDINYKFDPAWQEVQYIGRPDPVFIYKGITRNVSFDFIVAAQSKSEMQYIYWKVNKLLQMTSPTLTFDGSERMIAPIVYLTIGDFINDSTGSTMGQPCYLSNVSITIGNEYIWDINQNDAKSITSFEVPMYMKIAIEAKLIGDFTPSSTTNYFGTKNSNLDWLT